MDSEQALLKNVQSKNAIDLANEIKVDQPRLLLYYYVSEKESNEMQQ